LLILLVSPGSFLLADQAGHVALEVLDGGGEELRVVIKEGNRGVALPADQATELASHMVVIYCEASIGRWLPADVTETAVAGIVSLDVILV
jgi:hypothetical protein